MHQIHVKKNGQVIDVTNDPVLHAHLTKLGWQELVKEPSPSTTTEVPPPATPKVDYPSLSMQNTKDEIISTMESFGMPCRPDMTKEALLSIYATQVENKD